MTSTQPPERGSRVAPAVRGADGHVAPARQPGLIAQLRHRASGNVDGPVFIVGAGRSGTSAMLGAVRKTLGWTAFGEGHLYPVAVPLMLATHNYWGDNHAVSVNPKHMLAHVERRQFEDALLRVVRDTCIASHGTTRFVDKTPGPGALAALPYMQRVFPSMRVIYCQRRPIEVVRSAMRKFPDTSFDEHCRLWRNVMTRWVRVRDELSVPYVAVDQRDMRTRPDDVAARVGELLQLRPKQVALFSAFLRDDQPQSSGALNQGEVSISTTGWSNERKARFFALCKPAMDEHGWTEGPAYFAADTTDSSLSTKSATGSSGRKASID